jgi:predicted nucleic acid-binding protein
MTTAVLDTSVLARYLTGDDATKAAAVRTLLAGAEDGSLLFPDVALAELGFVLLRVYRWPARSVAAALRGVAMHPAIEVPHADLWLDVADDLESGRGLVDAYLLRTARAAGASTLLTFDTELKPIAGVRCRQP